MPYGNYNVSSLLSAARAAGAKAASLNDSIAAYEFDLSPKDAAAFQKYAGYLQGRLQSAQDMGDQSKILDYSKKITSAQRGYTSTEINRATTQVLYGNLNDSQKLQKMSDLYRQALESGDENLAQTVEMKAAILQQQMNRSKGFGGGGGSSAKGTAEAKGINRQLNKLDVAEKELKSELRTGKIKQSDYISKIGQIYDARDQVLGSTYKVNPDGTISTGNYPGLTDDQITSFVEKHQGIKASGDYRKYVGSDINAPMEMRLERQNTFFTPTYDPTTGDVQLKDNKIVGLRRGTEFGSNLDFGVSDNNLDNAKYQKAFKALGLGENISSGVIKDKEYTDPYGNVVRGDFYVNDPNKPSYAYTQDQQGNRYALLPNGKVSIIGDSVAADREASNLKQQLASGQITEQEYMDRLKNLNTDYVSPGAMQEYANAQQAQDNAQLGGLKGVFNSEVGRANKVLRGAGAVIDSIKRNKFVNDLGQRANSLSESLGLGNAFNGSGITGGLFGMLPGIGDLQNKVKDLEQKNVVRQQQIAAQRQAESDAALRALQAGAAAPQVNYAAGTISGVNGPRVIPGATIKASQTIGAQEFNQRYAPSGFGKSLYNKYL